MIEHVSEVNEGSETKTGLPSDKESWYAVNTKYKCEKYVVKMLSAKKIEAFLPLKKYTKRWNRKVKEFETPLISCYVFVRIDLVDKIRVLETEYVKGFVRFSNVIIPVKQEEIDLLKWIGGEDIDISAEPQFYSEGEKVEVLNGNLTGLTGTLVQYKGKEKVVVELTSIGYSLLLEIDVKYLRRTVKV